jgi:murein DD-endopeptidase MepM/ murein hydrolase activator NlpD
VKILEVIDQTDSILQNTDWTKTWLDWVNMVPLLQAQLPPDRVSKEQPTLQQVKAKLDAWRQANPNKFPDDAWTALGGKGPAPTPNEKIKGRDLRFQPPDDSGTWINGGTYWTHTIPPFIHAIKPDPTNKGTWGPKGADNSYISIADQISKIRPGLETAIQNDTAFQAKLTADTKGMSASDAKHYRQEMTDQLLNQQIEAKLRAIPGNGPGGKMYSNREINDGMRDEISVFNVNRMLHLNNKSEEAKEQKRQEEAEKKANKAAQKYYRKNKNKCPPGWIRNQANTACVRDPNQVPEPDEDDNCPPGWTYDEETDTCKKAETTPVVVPPKKEEEPPVVVPPKKEEEPPVVVPPKKEEEPPVTETARMILPAGDKNTRKTTLFGGNGGKHEGVDLAVPYGTDVVAPEAGTVFYFMTEPGTPGENGYGLNVKLRSTDGKREHVFGHLSAAFPAGESYTQGQKMAESGGIGKAYTKKVNGKNETVPANRDPRPGKSSGPHLHWGVKENGVFVDPLKFLK